MKRERQWVWVALILLLISAGAGYVQFKGNRNLYTQPKQVRYSFTLRNTTNQVIKDAGLSVYAPVKQTGTQVCTAIEASHPYKLETDPLGNQILNFSFSDLPPYATRIIKIKADLMFAEKPNRISDNKKGLSAFLKPEKYVESDQPSIISQARSLRKADDVATAENILNWVAGHIQGDGYVRNERGAIYALTGKTGDCTEYMDLFTALCRAAGIPSRRMGGYICGNNAVLSPAGFHNWSEFYHNGRWLLADPQNRMFMEKADNYVVVRIISDTCSNSMQGHNRFRVQGEDVTVKMNS